MAKVAFNKSEINGFKVIEIFNNDYDSKVFCGIYLYLDFKRLKDAKETMISHNITYLHLDIEEDDSILDLDFLIEFPFVTGVEVFTCNKSLDTSGIKFLKDLVFFSDKANIPKFKFDFTIFKNFKKCSIYWNKNVILPKSLEFLVLSKFKNKDLFSISHLTYLKHLAIVDSSVETLFGIENFSYLESLGFWNLRKLLTLSPLSALSTTLKAISIVYCKHIVDYSDLYDLKNLEMIHIGESAKLQTLTFLKAFRYIKHVNVSVEIEDGSRFTN